MNPRVSVIIPMHDSSATIAGALRSLHRQTLDSWEALVIDDASTDDSAAVVEGYARADRRVRLICRPRGGSAAARNTGIDAARGEFLVFLDADDWLMPGGITSLLRAAEGSEHGAAFGAASWFDARGESLHFTSEPTCRSAGPDELIEYNRFMIHAAVLSRDALAGERFDPALAANEDWDLWLRLAFRGVRWRTVWDEVAAYRCVPASRSRDWRAVADASASILRRAFDVARRRRESIDLGPERERRCLLRHALHAATASVVTDATPSCDLAASILAPFARPGCIDAPASANAAYWSLPLASALAPSAWSARAGLRTPADGQFCAHLARWWRRCIGEGWMDEPTADDALRALARLTADNSAVARRIADQLDTARPVVLLGFGSNGRRLARELVSRGFAVAARDDAADPAGEFAVISESTVRIVPGCAAAPRNAQCVATPTDDRRLIESLPADLRVVRWSEAAREEEERALALLRAAWPVERRAKGLAA